jgi:hypothetical protein
VHENTAAYRHISSDIDISNLVREACSVIFEKFVKHDRGIECLDSFETEVFEGNCELGE